MNTLEALKFFRKKKRISQANMLPGKDAKRYHRLESGQSKLDYEDLFTALNTLELSFKEFFGAIDMEENIPILAIDNQYKNCLYTLDDSAGKKILLRYFHELAAIKEKNTMETALYNDIKVVYHPIWPEIPKIDTADIEHVLNIIKKKTYYTYYDYRMTVNPIIFFDTEKVQYILERMYPIENQKNRDFTTVRIANLIYPNIITGQLYRNNLDQAAYYIQKAKEANVPYDDYHFHFNLHYLDNLTNYLITKETKYLTKILQEIELLEQFGNFELANGIKEEATNLILGKDFYNLDEGIILNNLTETPD
ncbi:helix-turn-helix domain-containing protein [Enterococcus faecalis]